MGSIIDRLKELMQAHSLNNNSLTVQAKLSVGLVGQAIKNNKGLHSDTIQKILNTYPDVSAEWFVMGRGAMKREANYTLPVAADPQAQFTGVDSQVIEAAKEAARVAVREEMQLLQQRKRTSPVAVAGVSRNGDGAKIKKS